VGAEAAAAGIGAAAGAGEIGTAVGAATIPETIVTETGTASLLGKVVALGKSVWALAAAHPVIAIATVATAIIVPTLILIAYRKNKAKNVIIPQGDEVPQSDP
jgi:nitrate/nitrite transporter NarK